MQNEKATSVGKSSSVEKSRLLCDIAKEIRRDWKNLSPYAQPYLEAMFSLTTMDSKYYLDDASGVVAYFLANAATWRGETAKRVKKELNDMLKRKRSGK